MAEKKNFANLLLFRDGGTKMRKQKRIICLCLILAMFVTILPCEVKAQGKKTWGEAYEEVLKKYGSDATAKLIYQIGRASCRERV